MSDEQERLLKLIASIQKVIDGLKGEDQFVVGWVIEDLQKAIVETQAGIEEG